LLYLSENVAGVQMTNMSRISSLLVDPGSAVAGVGENLLRLEPQGNLLLGVLDAVGAVADVAADLGGNRLVSREFEIPNLKRFKQERPITYVNGEVATDGAGGGGQGVGGTQEGTASLDGVTALPNHGADRAAQHV
jgi:hypothetical protein